MRLFCRI